MSRKIIIISIFSFFIINKVLIAQCPPIPPFNTWSAQQFGSGFDNGCYSIHTSSSGIFAAGAFTEKVVELGANNLLQLGVPFGSGSNTSGRVFELESSGGKLFAVGNNNSGFLQEWDGNTWSEVTGVNNPAYSIATHNSKVYVGHTTNNFFYNGNSSYRGVFSWDINSQTLSALGDGLDFIGQQGQGGVGIITALATNSSGDLYASGGFNRADGNPVNDFAMWNGLSWESVGGGLPGGAETIIFADNGDLYAGGYFTTAGGNSANHIAVWNGTTWSTLGSGLNGNCFALAFDAEGNLFVGGDFTSAGGVPVNNLAMWDGSSWSAVGSGTNGIVQAIKVIYDGISCERFLMVGGEFTQANGVSANRIAVFTTQCDLDTSVSLNGSTLTSNATNVSYQWVDCNNNFFPIADANSASYTPTSTGEYAVVISDEQCADTSACIKICIEPNINLNVLNATITVTPAGLNYQWIDCNNGNSPILGATGQFYTATESGSYAVEVQENGCVSNTSSCEDIVINSLDIVNKTNDINFFPNPVKDFLEIELSSLNEISIFDLYGKKIKQLTVNGYATIDFSEFEKGVYFIEIFNSDLNHSKTIKILNNQQ